MCDVADSGSEINLHVLGSSVGKYLYSIFFWGNGGGACVFLREVRGILCLLYR